MTPSSMHSESSNAHTLEIQQGTWPGDRGLTIMISGAVLLIIVGLVALPSIARRTSQLAPATTPEGVVQRFYQAVYAGDYTAAYAFISADTQQRLALLDLQQQISAELQHSQVRVTKTTVVGDQATVWVTQTTVQPGGLFGSNEWSIDREILLQREGDQWRIRGGPFVVPETKPSAIARW